MIKKDDMERMCSNAGMRPEKRAKIDGHEVFIADGFSKVPHFTFAKFGVNKGEFPDGAYCTIWFCVKGEDKLDYGLPLLFEKNHDHPSLVEEGQKRTARINRALQDAKKSLAKRREILKEGLV